MVKAYSGRRLSDISLSNDAFHTENPENTPAMIASAAADDLGKSTYSICIEAPTIKPPDTVKGEPVVGVDTLFKGRAADKQASELSYATSIPPLCRDCALEFIQGISLPEIMEVVTYMTDNRTDL